jgi:peptidoglycan/LPS O-acetylase OafA/YrhL
MPLAAPSESPRLPVLDGLRGIAATVVVVSHVSNECNLWGGLFGFGGGQLGVMLFFVLSGYLMASLYEPKEFRAAEVRRYLQHRVARVVPLYYALVALALLATLHAPAIAVYPVIPSNALEHFLFVAGVSVFWTIPVEVQFYGVFVGLWALARHWPRLDLAVRMALLVAVIATRWHADDPSTPTLASTLPYFLAGTLLPRLPAWCSRASRHAWSAAFVLATLLTVWLFPGVSGRPRAAMWDDPLHLLVITLLLVASRRAPLAERLLGSAPMVWLGRISYSVYLLHLVVLKLLARHTELATRPVAFLLTTLGLTLLGSELVYRGFEARLRTRLNALRWHRHG